MTSDPQGYRSGPDESNNFGVSKANNEFTSKVVRDWAANSEDVRGLAIIGDQTELWQWDQPTRFIQWYGAKTTKIPLYAGLGNHDYLNNYGDCYNGGEAVPILGIGIPFSDQLADYSPILANAPRCPYNMQDNCQMAAILRHRHYIDDQLPASFIKDSASMSYAWREDKYLFVMTNHNPYTEVPASTGAGCILGKVKAAFSASGSSWLKTTVESGTRQGLRIIIFIHNIVDTTPFCNGDCISKDLREDTAFKNFISSNNVVGIFSGHTHVPPWGYDTDSSTALGVPVFNGGCSYYRTILKGSFLDEGYTVEIDPEQLKFCATGKICAWEAAVQIESSNNGRLRPKVTQVRAGNS